MKRETTSFDPKTWLDDRKPSPETTSFNPKTWVGDGPPPATDGKPQPGSPPRRVPLLASLAGLALAIATGAWFWLGSEDAADSGDGAAATATPTAPAGAVIESAPTEAPRIVSVRNYQDLGIALEQMGVPLGEAMAIAREAVGALGVEDQEMRIEVVLTGRGEARTVHSLVAELDGGTGVKLTRQSDGTFAREENFLNAETRYSSATGTYDGGTFYTSALGAGMPDSLTTPFAKAFSFDFDFRDLSRGDTFLAVWEERVTSSGRRLSPPRLIYAELRTAVAGSHAYYAFTPPDEVEPRWFDAQGNGAARGLMRTPVDGARITSGFGGRRHPVLGILKNHNGTDFGAPVGTPIYASGNATVAAVLPMHGAAGNMIKLQHGENMQTWYMHLVRFAEGISAGQAVNQGEIIGYVGATGRVTGAHLHYEVRIDGVPTDPLTYETTKVEPLVGEAMTMFAARRAEIDAARK
ncbi:peptidoglycan DD-metalloendopeptidase family protein [Tsuneonella sp. SYSU-LHT278]|uniref:M23 family metallopeptidase n=1 Tax=Tsuneonella sediminis TaxID=3416089 RepID=UPI003F78EB5C